MVRRDITEVLADLPLMCAAIHPTTGKPVLLKRGSIGYWPYRDGMDVDKYNARNGVTPAQCEAMLVGSMFGFDVPGADPLNN